MDLRGGGHAVEGFDVEVLKGLVGHGRGFRKRNENPDPCEGPGWMMGCPKRLEVTLTIPRAVRVERPILVGKARGHGASRVFHPEAGGWTRQADGGPARNALREKFLRSLHPETMGKSVPFLNSYTKLSSPIFDVTILYN